MKSLVSLSLAAALLICSLFAPSSASAQTVFVCSNVNASSTFSCSWPSQWTLKSPASVAESDKVLRCPSATPGTQDVTRCSGVGWVNKSAVLDTEYVAICTNGVAGGSPTVCDVSNGGGEGYQQKSTVFGGSSPPPAIPTVSLTASPQSIQSGQSSTLSWSSSNATSCVANGNWSGTKATSGSQSTGALTVTSDYTLTCTGAGGTTSRTVTVTVSSAPPPPAAPTVSLSVSPQSIQSGQSSTLSWSTTNATSCTASGNWSGSKSTSGSQSTGTLQSTATFMLTCSGTGGSASDSETVTVAAAAPPGGAGFSRIMVDPASMNRAWSKALGDIDGDGRPDYVVAGATGPIYWYRATDFARTLISSTAQTDSGACTGDIDGDGRVDVVAGNTWYKNPTWTATAIDVPGNHDCVVTDINNDGRNDILIRAEQTPEVYLFTQQFNVTFRKATLNPGVGLNGLAVADLRNIGTKNIIVGGRWAEMAGCNIDQWVWHDFASWNPYAYVETGDIDADGKMDIVLSVSEEGGPYAKVSWFKQPADPFNSNWAETVVLNNAGPVHGFGVADFNLDGRKDIFVSEYGGSGAEGGTPIGQGRQILLSQGAGNSWTSNVVANDYVHGLRCADTNGDGKVDCFGANAWGVAPVILYRRQ